MSGRGAKTGARLLEVLVQSERGYTMAELEDILEVGRNQIHAGLRWLRRYLSESARYTVVSEQVGKGGWRHRLADTWYEVVPYVDNQSTHLKTRMQSMLDIATATSKGDRRTMQVKEALTVKKALTRLIEDLEEMREEAHIEV